MLSFVRVAVAVLACLVLGFVVAVLGSFQHPAEAALGSARFPLGVVVGIGALVLAEFVARDAAPLGLGPAIVLVGWTVTVAVLGTSRPEGDLIVPANAAGQAFLYGGFLIGIVVAVTLALSAASGVRPGRR